MQGKPFEAFLSLTSLLSCAGLLVATVSLAGPVFYPKLSDESAACNECHKQQSPAIVQQWGESKHYRGNVGCFECHASKAGEPGAYEHNGAFIHTIVTPRDCARCHEREVAETEASHHAKGAEILGSLDNTLAEVVEGNTAFFGGSALLVNGCQQCHGATVKVDAKGRPTPDTWPNTGIGRINLDGSRGSCSACHQRHTFSAAQARRPENCGKCHLGPDHPQKEIYDESKHGISFMANAGRINIDNPKWVVGEDYSVGPTCATCHLSATPTQGVTHNVGDRISWNNRPEVSIRTDLADAKLGLANPIPWEKRRSAMKDVCTSCHGPAFADSFYQQYDGLVELYNEKFAKPGKAIFEGLKKAHLADGEPFANRIDWTWYEIWHHQGRRARHGASMQGPDYTHWHGLFEVGKAFYSEFIPEAQDLVAKGIAAGGEKAKAAQEVGALIQATLESDNHKWFIGKMTPEEKARRAKQREEFAKRYVMKADAKP
ncbi:MAG: cytochrome c3 family protein [Acidobacteriia bacterium]|nr:cytochrome c3 family protein [Terriglobia bacterium]